MKKKIRFQFLDIVICRVSKKFQLVFNFHIYYIVVEQEAEVEEERLRREREERDRQDAMTLGETKEQIQILNTRLKELRNEKQQLFMRLKKVFNEDEKRKKQQQQKERYVIRRGQGTHFGNKISINRKSSSILFLFLAHSIHSEMYAMQQSMAQQQGSHQQIFMPPRAPHLMPKVLVSDSKETSISIVQLILIFFSQISVSTNGWRINTAK